MRGSPGDGGAGLPGAPPRSHCYSGPGVYGAGGGARSAPNVRESDRHQPAAGRSCGPARVRAGCRRLGLVMDAAGERSFVALGRSRMPYPAVVPSVCEINGKSFVNVYRGRFVRGC